MVQTSTRRAGDRFTRGLMFFIAILTVPLGIYGVVGQHAAGAGVVSVLGLGTLWIWYALRPRYASPRARRLGQWCALLTIAVAVAIVGFLTLLVSTPGDGASSARVNGELACAFAAIVLLGTRLITGQHLKRRAAAGAAPVTPQQETAARRLDDASREADEQLTSVAADMRHKWQHGEAPVSAAVTVEPGGTVVLRPAGLRRRGWLRASAGAVPLALILIIRTISSGWAGALVAAAAVAVILALALAAYEIRARNGIARLGPAEVSVRTGIWGQRSAPRTQIQRVVLVRAELGSTQSRMTPLLLLLGGDGHCVLRVSGSTPMDLMRFATALPVPLDVADRPLGPEDLRRQYPGSVPWAVQHQVLVAVLLTVAIVAIVTGVVAGLAAAGLISSPG